MDWMALLWTILECIGGCAIAATLTPNSNKNKVIDYGLQAINAAGMNLGKARNR